MPQAVNGDSFEFQGGTRDRGGYAVLVQQVLHAVNAEAATLSVGKQHLSITAMGLA